jgi:hypothetical protein
MMPYTIKYEGDICSVMDENMDFEGRFQTFEGDAPVFTGTGW